VAFIAYKGGTSSLWIRALDSFAPQLLTETEGALAPFWSPDSRMVAFFSEGKLKKIAPSGGAPQTICDVPSHVVCGSWSTNGSIVFAALEAPDKNGLYRVSATGAAVKLQIPKAENVPLHVFFPHFLPDGNEFLFVGIGGVASERFLYWGRLQDSSEELQVRLMGSLISRVEYDPSGYLLAVRDNTLVAQPFDAAKVTFLGEPIPFIENVGNFGGGAASFSISQNGVLLYQLETPAASQIEWFDRTGRTLGSVGIPSQYVDIRLSPDGERIAATIAEPSTGAGDIWILSLPQGNATRLTADLMDDFGPVWSPDGREVVFSSSRDGVPHLFRQGLGESDPRVMVPMNGHVQDACDWTPDCVLYTDRDPSTAQDIWAMPVSPNAEPVSIVRSRFKEVQADVSPNGRWIAYASNESGQYEIYIQEFSPSGVKGEKRRISSSGGLAPTWSGKGEEIIYIDLAAEPSLMTVALDAESGEPSGAPQRLFQLRTQVQAFEVTSDGQRFLVNHVASASSVPVMNFVVNWPEVVRQAQEHSH
jgi:Tol biopolymer transport system component